MNRKLIRPTLAEVKERELATGKAVVEPRRRNPLLPDQTNAENHYYKKQVELKTPMVIVLQDGEYLRGIIEWYDKNCLKLHRNGAPNLLVLKHNIKYMYKEDEEI